MPQFDFTTYSAQIFWLAICFFVLYFAMANIILPRIRNIIADRKNVVSDDLLATESLNEKSGAIKNKTNEVLLAADLRYKIAMEDAVKRAAIQKENSMEAFKNQAEMLIEKSQSEIEKILQNSAVQNQAVVEKLVAVTQNKIFNS